MKDEVLPIVVRSSGLLKINAEILPSNCNKAEIINDLYRYIASKYAFTYGKYKISDINRDLTDLLRREGIL